MRPQEIDGWQARVRTLMSDRQWHTSTEIRDAANRHSTSAERLAVVRALGAEFRRVSTSGRPRDEWRVAP